VALVECGECGREISDRAPACPHCGMPVEATGSGDRPQSSVLGLTSVALGLAAAIMPYFAAVFFVPASLVCGAVAYRRGQRKSGLAGIILGMLGLLGIFYVSHQIGEVAGSLTSGSGTFARPPGTTQVVTSSEYGQLRDGMTYSQVQAIIGAPGQELSRSDLAGIVTVMYSWTNSDGSNMNAMFQNGALVMKAQFGLR